MSNNYIIYHLHTELSSLVTSIDSVNNYKQYIDKAASLNMKAICFSEHGSIFSWLHKKEYCKKSGLKYLHGIEVYVTESFKEKIRDNYHMILIAKNYDGFLELNALVSKSFNRAKTKVIDDVERFYYNPRISIEELMQTSENIIITTACIASILGQAKPRYLKRLLLEFMSRNSDRCFLEVQHHNVQEQIYYNKWLYKLSRRYKIRLISATDTHSLNKEYAEARIILQKAKKIFFDDDKNWDLVFKTYEELVESYKIQKSLPESVYLEAIENTNLLYDIVEDFVIDRSNKYPTLSHKPKAEILKLIDEGLKFRKVSLTEEVKERINKELDVFEKNDVFNFLLLDYDYKKFARSKNIGYGDSRGSISGSFIAYLLQITNTDSIKYKMNFERFIHSERISLAD